MIGFRWLRIFLAVLLALAAFPPIAAVAKEPKMKDLADSVLSNRIMTKFAILLRASDLASFLSSRGPFTLFVPTDSAFSRISPDAFAALQRPENKEALQRIVLFHVVNGQRLTSIDLGKLKTLLSCEGTALPLRINHTGYQIVSKAKILHADIRTLNGLMHEIDTVLLPPGISLAAMAAAVPPPAPPADTNAAAGPMPPTNAASTNGAPASDATNSTAPPSEAVPAAP